jgi:tetratricopeptide (TPR) repeat protein
MNSSTLRILEIKGSQRRSRSAEGSLPSAKELCVQIAALARRSADARARSHSEDSWDAASHSDLLVTQMLPKPSEEPAYFRRIGVQLFEALSEEEQRTIRGVETGQRLRLVVKELPGSSSPGLPWELLCFPEEDGGFLSADPRYSFVRHARSGEDPPVGMGQTSVLSVAPIAIQPESSGEFDVPRVELNRDLYRGVYQALPLGTCFEPLVRPDGRAGEAFSVQDLRQLLHERKPTVLHLMAHGIGAALLFAQERGRPIPVEAAELGSILKDCSSLRLVFLGVCGGASLAEQWGAHSNLAVVTGNASQVPWLVASRVTLSSETLRNFCNAMYEGLSAGIDIETAVALGRKRLLDQKDWTFGSIVCYVQSKYQRALCFDRQSDTGSGHSPRVPAMEPHQTSKISSFDVQVRRKHNERLKHYDDLRAYFTGSDNLRREFTAALSKTKIGRQLWVIHGLPGTGKSQLLYMFYGQCRKRREPLPVAWVSLDDAKSTPYILSKWADELAADQTVLPTFADMYRRYCLVLKTSNEIQMSRAVLSGRVEAIQDVLAQHGIRAEIDLDLYTDPTRRLTEAFLTDIEQVAEHHRLILMVDTYEQVDQLEHWFCDLAQQLPPNTILVLAGHGEPKWERHWPTWRLHAISHELKEMTDQEMRTLLARFYSAQGRDQPSPDHVEKIVQFAKGLPLLVTSMGDLWLKYNLSMDELPLVETGSVSTFVQKLKESIGGTLFPFLEAAAVVRGFNKGILRAVTGLTDVEELYSRLRSFPFVRDKSRELRALHDAVREILDYNLRADDRERYRVLHKQAADYYEKQFVSAQGEESQELELEWLYHQMHASEQTGIRLFQTKAEEMTRYRLLGKLSALLKDVNSYPSCFAHDNSRSWLKYYVARLDHLELRLTEAEQGYMTISQDSQAEPRLRAYALCDLADINNKEPHIKATHFLARIPSLGVPLDAKLTNYLLLRGDIHGKEGNWEEAISSLKQVEQFFISTGDLFGLVFAYCRMKAFYSERGLWREALKMRDLAIQHKSALVGHLFLQSEILGNLGIAWVWIGRYADGERDLRAALDIRMLQHWPSTELCCSRDLGLVFGFQDRFEAAKRHIFRSIELAQQSGLTFDVEFGKSFLGIVEGRCGEFAPAIENLTFCVQAFYRRHEEWGMPWVLCWRGFVHETQREYKLAAEDYNESLILTTRGRLYHHAAALTGLARISEANGDYDSLPSYVEKGERLAWQHEHNDHLASLRLIQGHVAWDGLVSGWNSGFTAALRYYQQAVIHALRFNRFLLDEVLKGREQGSPLRPLIPYCLARGNEGRRMLGALLDWWKIGMNDLGNPRPDTISPIPEGISLVEAERMARQGEPVGGLPQEWVVNRIREALDK